MIKKRAAFGLALPISLALACAACGSNNGQAGTFNQLAGSKGYITQSDATNHNWTAQQFEQCDADHDGKVTRTEYDACRQNISAMGTESFSQLAGSKGYISESDATSHNWTQQEFQQCDSNHDGKLTRTEFDACGHNAGAMQQPQTGAAMGSTAAMGGAATGGAAMGGAAMGGAAMGGVATGSSSAMQQPQTSAAMGTETFDQLAGSKDYISQSDATSHNWTKQQFEQCDSDHDGKLSRTEFDACRQQGGAMQQPQGSGQ